jgi:hypothetical protein
MYVYTCGGCADPLAPTCPVEIRHIGTSFNPDEFVVKEVTQHTITAPGKGYLILDAYIDVARGDVIGFRTLSGGGELAMTSCDPQDNDFDCGVVSATVSDVIAPGTPIPSSRHLLRAISSGMSTVDMHFNFATTGQKTVYFDTINSLNAGNPESFVIDVIEGVDRAWIRGPIYVASGEATSFTLETHTGTE